MEPLKKLSCIYLIINVVDYKVYVGSTVNFYRRIAQHKNHLQKNIHRSSYLQRAWIKYGNAAFKFSILEKVQTEKLIEREQYWLDIFESYIPSHGYNIRSIADRNNNLKAWNKDIWKKKVSEKNLVNYYLNGYTMKECREKFRISIDTINMVLTRNGVKRTKKESRKIRDNKYPEYAKLVGKKNLGKLSGKNHPNFGKVGFWSGKKLSKSSRKQATSTRKQKYGHYFSADGYKNLKLYKNQLRGIK